MIMSLIPGELLELIVNGRKNSLKIFKNNLFRELIFSTYNFMEVGSSRKFPLFQAIFIEAIF